MKRYDVQPFRKRWPRRLFVALGVVIAVLIVAVLVIRYEYNRNLQPVTAHAQAKSIEIKTGMTANQIGDLLHNQHIIRHAWAFNWYVQNKEVRDELQAGTYSLCPCQSVPDIVSQLTHGKVQTDTITIIPGSRLDQIKQTFVNAGFKESAVETALNPASYPNNAALVDKPAGASLEGYLYPDTFQKNSSTQPQTIVAASLAEMQKHLTPDIRAAFAREGLSTYQGIVLASIVEQEVSNQTERAQAAQVFLTRLSTNMPLGSDVTALYGSLLADHRGSLTYDTPYNTLIHTGLPPTPISNVSAGSLQAVAHPASTDWLYFVTGDDGVTHFAHTLEEHQANVAQYCHKLCGQ
jgi:UPF0755 protein